MEQMFRIEARPQGISEIGRTVTASGIYTDYVSDTGRAYVRIESAGETSWWRLELAKAA